MSLLERMVIYCEEKGWYYDLYSRMDSLHEAGFLVSVKSYLLQNPLPAKHENEVSHKWDPKSCF